VPGETVWSAISGIGGLDRWFSAIESSGVDGIGPGLRPDIAVLSEFGKHGRLRPPRRGVSAIRSSEPARKAGRPCGDWRAGLTRHSSRV
jgi:hypothetical protein